MRPWFKCASIEYKESYFSDNLNVDLYRTKGGLDPPGPALLPISGISNFLHSFLYIKRTQKTHDCFQDSNLVRIREGLMVGGGLLTIAYLKTKSP